jgi:hypothetical protein
MAILAFSRFYPWDPDVKTMFAAKIHAGIKKHTFRSNKNKYDLGDVIKFWDGSPHDLRINPRRFMLWPENRIVALEKYWMKVIRLKEGDEGWREDCWDQFKIELRIGDFWINTGDLLDLVAVNDGFDSGLDFVKWFSFKMDQDGDSERIYEGSVIHWNKDSVYDIDNAEVFEGEGSEKFFGKL